MAEALAWIKRFWWVFAIVAAIGLTLWIGGLIAAPFVWLGDKLDGVFCYSQECKAERLQDALDAALSDRDARLEELEGRQAISEANDAAQARILQSRTITTEAVTQAQGAPDAQTPVSGDLARVLVMADDRLCAVQPASCAGQPADR